MSDFFVNDKYRVLECMATRQIAVNDEQVVKLSQQEIADILRFTKTKVNMWNMKAPKILLLNR